MRVPGVGLSQRHFVEAYGISSIRRHYFSCAARRSFGQGPFLIGKTPMSIFPPGLWSYLAPILLLACSNIFMTVAWYGHLKFKAWHMAVAIIVSWSIAFIEYCFAVPANRIGNAVYSPAELKSLQEVITLSVFAGFTAIYFKEPLTLIQGVGFALIALGALLVFRG
jgi:uncharacterized protein